MIHQYELKAEEIRTYTRQVMKRHLQIEANGYSCKTDMIFDLLMKASAECSSLEAACADLEEVADSNTVREYVNKCLPADQLSEQEEAHGAFAVNGKRNWMRNVPLKLAIGLVEGEKTRFVGGAVDAVQAKTKTYVTLVPGDETGKEFLKKILKALTLKLPKEQREKISKTSIEQVRKFVPYTKGRLVKNVS